MYPDPNQPAGRYPTTSRHPTSAGPVPSPPLPQSTYPQQPATSQPYNAYAQSYQSQQQQQQGYPQQSMPYAPQPSTYPAYQQPQNAYAMPQQPYDPLQYAAGAFMPGPTAEPGQGDAQVFMPSLSPLNLMTAGSTLFSGGQTWGQQYLQKAQQRMSWLSGSALSFHFNVSNSYVRTKVAMLCAPYLRRWTYCRQPDQGSQQFLPPRLDVNSPDLYLPVMSLWTYVMGVLMLQLLQHKYKPDLMYSTVWNGSFSWLLHALLLALILRAMNLPASVPWLDLFAYTGYAYVPACLIIVAGVLAGKWGYYVAWLYLSCCMAVFLVRTLKRAVFQETRNFGKDLSFINYLLLSLAVFQFPFLFWMTNLQLPHLTPMLFAHLQAAAAPHGAAQALLPPLKGPA